jgi:exopolysaccharide biosynthesis polyprenyl glycosylphosphotransferase
VSDHVAPLPAARLYDPMWEAVDARTLAIVEQRRRAGMSRRRGWLMRRLLLVADLVGLTLAFVVTQLVFPADSSVDHVSGSLEYLLFALTLPVWIVVAKLYGLYDHDAERTDHSTADELVDVLHLVTIGSWAVFAGGILTGLARPELAKLALLWGLAVVFVTIARASARAFCRRRMAFVQNTVIVGAGETGQLVARKLTQHPEYGINLVGFVDAAPMERRGDLDFMNVLGPPERLPAIVEMFDVERVVIAFCNDSHDETLDLIRSLKDLDVQVDIVPRLFEIVGPGVSVHTVEGLPLMGLRPSRLSHSSRFIKRAFDLTFSAAGLMLLAPLFAVIAVAIKIDSRGPVFFRQVRMGAGEQTFRIFKFRTMTADADRRKTEVAHMNMHAHGGGDTRMFKVANDPRITRVGAVLRRFSLDEFPQLINVLKGEMSLVGPRPLILDEDRYVTEWARSRLRLKPGMTGLWQVLGASEIPFEEMTKLDYLYVTTWSLWTDVRLIMRTVPAVVRARNAY